jgi:hypothetical protein
MKDFKTTARNRLAVSRIVRQYRILAGNSDRHASLRQFAETLSEALQPLGRAISYQSVKNWQDQLYLPDAFVMLRLSQAARYDWRGDFAVDILAAIDPASYLPASEIGRRILGHDNSFLKGAWNSNGKEHNGNGNGHKANGNHGAQNGAAPAAGQTETQDEG